MLEGLRLALAVVLVAGLAVWLGSNLLQEFGGDVARARSRVYRKRKNAVQFWLTWVVQIVMLVGCLYVLTQLVPRLFE